MSSNDILIGGVSFDGTGNINLPGVNTAGNQNTSGNISLFNKISGVTIFISIFFAVLVTENQIDYKFGEQIDLIDWVIGGLFCIE